MPAPEPAGPCSARPLFFVIEEEERRGTRAPVLGGGPFVSKAGAAPLRHPQDQAKSALKRHSLYVCSSHLVRTNHPTQWRDRCRKAPYEPSAKKDSAEGGVSRNINTIFFGGILRHAFMLRRVRRGSARVTLSTLVPLLSEAELSTLVSCRRITQIPVSSNQ